MCVCVCVCVCVCIREDKGVYAFPEDIIRK